MGHSGAAYSAGDSRPSEAAYEGGGARCTGGLGVVSDGLPCCRVPELQVDVDAVVVRIRYPRFIHCSRVLFGEEVSAEESRLIC